jgi:hypothetical protein
MPSNPNVKVNLMAASNTNPSTPAQPPEPAQASEVDRLRAENERLRAENAKLRAAAESNEGRKTMERPTPVEPSFGMSEGTRQEIEQAKARLDREPDLDQVDVVDPFTGKPQAITRDGD